jgi:hypothetical protein
MLEHVGISEYIGYVGCYDFDQQWIAGNQIKVTVSKSVHGRAIAPRQRRIGTRWNIRVYRLCQLL